MNYRISIAISIHSFAEEKTILIKEQGKMHQPKYNPFYDSHTITACADSNENLDVEALIDCMG